MAPTRELVCQIYEESCRFGQKAGISTAVAYGGADKKEQLRVFNWENPAVAVRRRSEKREFF
jgi:superfamily II DNA/RNA helicase